MSNEFKRSKYQIYCKYDFPTDTSTVFITKQAENARQNT